MLSLQLASNMQVFTSAAASVTCYSNDGSSWDNTPFLNGNLWEVTIANGDVTMAKYDEDTGTLVVADFVDDAWQHGEDFVAACL